VTVTYDALYETFAFSDYGFFSEPYMIPNTEEYVTFMSGDSALCQLAYLELGFWGTEIVTVGNTLTGADNIMFVPIPMYILVDQSPQWKDDFGGLVGSGAYFIAEIGDTIIPYVGNASALVDVQSYGDYFKQVIANMYDKNVTVDSVLYDEKAFNGGAEMFFMNYDELYSTYRTATVKYAEFYPSATLEYYAEIEWLDYLNPGRLFGLAVEMDEEGIPLSVVEPYDVRTVSQICTNMEISLDEPAESSAKSGYYIIDPARVHIGKDINTVLDAYKMYKK
jgi:hypothetical protein